MYYLEHESTISTRLRMCHKCQPMSTSHLRNSTATLRIFTVQTSVVAVGRKRRDAHGQLYRSGTRNSPVSEKKKSEPVGPSPVKSGQVRAPPIFLRLPAGRTGAAESIFHATAVETASPGQRGDRPRAGSRPCRLVQIVDFAAK